MEARSVHVNVATVWLLCEISIEQNTNFSQPTHFQRCRWPGSLPASGENFKQSIHTKKTKQTCSEIVWCSKMEWHWKEVLNKWRKQGMESQDSSWNLSVIRKQSCSLSAEINIRCFSTRMMKMIQTQPSKLSTGFRERE